MNTVAKINVTAIIAEVLQMQAEELSPESSMLNTPNWDSLAHVTIITAIETALGRQFDIDQIASAISVRDLCDLVEKTNRSKQ